MAKYVVGYCDFFENKVNLFQVEAPTPNAAVVRVLNDQGWEIEEENPTDDELKEIIYACSDMDVSDPMLISD